MLNRLTCLSDIDVQNCFARELLQLALGAECCGEPGGMSQRVRLASTESGERTRQLRRHTCGMSELEDASVGARRGDDLASLLTFVTVEHASDSEVKEVDRQW